MSVQELFVDGERLVGNIAREKNLSSVLSISNMVKSSYGPHGLDKMLISKVGDVTITNDGATILALAEAKDPAARILADLAAQQDKEAGDGTTSVALLAAALIESGTSLIKSGVHPTLVVSGYKTAFKEAISFVKNTLEKKIKNVTSSDLMKISESTISSKVIRVSSKTFSKIMVDAIQTVKRAHPEKGAVYAIEEINVLKKQGKSMEESIFVQGYALNCLPVSKLMPNRISKAKVVCLDMDLQQIKMGLSVKITTETPEDLEKIREKETHASTEKVKKLVKAGANVILTTKGISDSCSKVLIEAGAMGVRRCKKEDLERIAALVETQVYTSFEEIDGAELVPILGVADSVQVETFGEEQCLVINASRGGGSSIILRGANEQMLDEMERSVHDGLCALKRTLESKSVVVGGGAFETALCVYLSNFAMSFRTNEQIAIQKFGEALLSIPKTLLINAALDTNTLLAKLLSEHEKQQWDMGVDLDRGAIRNNYKEGVIEPTEIKTKALRAATEAAISILRIDERIVLFEEQKK